MAAHAVDVSEGRLQARPRRRCRSTGIAIVAGQVLADREKNASVVKKQEEVSQPWVMSAKSRSSGAAGVGSDKSEGWCRSEGQQVGITVSAH